MKQAQCGSIIWAFLTQLVFMHSAKEASATVVQSAHLESNKKATL